jgi:hypothetical protein
MRPAHVVHRFPAALIACLALALAIALAPDLRAQEPPGLSSGTGQGTGTGRSAGIQRNRTGSNSGTGPERRGGQGFEGEMLPPPSVRPGQSVPRGPGVNVRFPDDPALGPLLSGEEARGPADAKGAALVTQEVLKNAQLVTENYDRSRAMEEVAREAIFSNQLLLAHHILEQAATAALKEENSLRHDQLIIEAITTTTLLTETLIREGKAQPVLLEADDTRPDPIPRKLDPKLAIRLARLEWQRAAYLARQIDNPTYRSEYLERVVEGMGKDSTRIVIEYVKGTDRPSDEVAKKNDQQTAEFAKSADDLLIEATQIAIEIERPIWRNQALVRSAISAGESYQFSRATSIASNIENAEARAQAYLLVAESQCRQNQDEQATQTYQEVVKAVARVQQNGLRGVLTGYLVDSLISTGRFEDARASLVLYPTESERFVALEAIAESQGKRGAAASAREWIAREARPEYRSALYRRVNSGVLAAIETERSSLYLGKDVQAPTPPPPSR